MKRFVSPPRESGTLGDRCECRKQLAESRSPPSLALAFLSHDTRGRRATIGRSRRHRQWDFERVDDKKTARSLLLFLSAPRPATPPQQRGRIKSSTKEREREVHRERLDAAHGLREFQPPLRVPRWSPQDGCATGRSRTLPSAFDVFLCCASHTQSATRSVRSVSHLADEGDLSLSAGRSNFLPGFPLRRSLSLERATPCT